MNQKKLLDQLNKKGMSEERASYSYVPTELQIIEADAVMGGDPKYKEIEKWDSESAIIVVKLKLLNGDSKGKTVRLFGNLFNKNGELSIYPTYIQKGTGKKKAGSLLYDLIHAIKKHDESQWEVGDFVPDKLLNKKLTMDVRANGEYIFVKTSVQALKDEEYEKANSKPEKDGEGVSEEEMDLPFD